MKVFNASALALAILASIASCKTTSLSSGSTTKNMLPGPDFETLILEKSNDSDITIGGSPTFNLTVAIFTEAMCENNCMTVAGETSISNGTVNFHISEKGRRHGNHATVASASTKIILTPDIKRIHISTYQGAERMIEIDPNTSIVEGRGRLDSGLVAIGGETSGSGFFIQGKVYELDRDDNRTLLQTDKFWGMTVRVKGTLVEKTGGVETGKSKRLRTISVIRE